MSIRIRTVAGIALLALSSAACAGPHAPLEIGSKDVPVDIVLGQQQQLIAPAPGSNPVAGFPGFISPPIPIPEPGAPPPPAQPPQKCPLASPFDASKLVAYQTAPKPPVPATYVYRNNGMLKVGAGVATSFPPEQTRTVRNVKPDGSGNFDFDVAALLEGVLTTTTYRVMNTEPTPDRGVYIAAVVTTFADGTTESFNPDQPILLMPFPAPELGTGLEDEINHTRGQGYQSAGTDPISQTTMDVQAKIDGKTRANACGEWVDAWDIEVTQGKIAGPTKNVDFTGHYLIAPQYGGLVVQDDLSFSGTENVTETIDSHNVATIDRVPVEPR
jgi:hypothetical protein